MFPRAIPTDGLTPLAWTEALWEALQARYHERLYCRGEVGQLCYLDDRGVLHAIDDGRMTAMVDQAGYFTTFDGEGNIRIRRPNREDRTSVLNGMHGPSLSSIRSSPFYTVDGRLVNTPGLDQTTRTYLVWQDSTIPDPSAVTDEDAIRCVRSLLDGFSFHTRPANYSHALGLLLLVVLRQAIDGPTPLHAITATVENVGKSTLGRLPGVLLTGNATIQDFNPWASEQSRTLDAALADDPAFMFFDNVPTGAKLDDPKLVKLLTATDYRARVIGTGRQQHIQCRPVWVATANLLDYDAEQARRTVAMELVKPDVALPQVENFDGWVRTNRTHILSCLLRIAGAWYEAGQPRAPRTLPSFSEWSRVIGGAVEHAAVRFGLGEPGAFLHPDSRPMPSEHKHWYVLFAQWPRDIEEKPMWLQSRAIGEKIGALDLSTLPRFEGPLGKALVALYKQQRIFGGMRLATRLVGGIRQYRPERVPGSDVVEEVAPAPAEQEFDAPDFDVASLPEPES